MLKSYVPNMCLRFKLKKTKSKFWKFSIFLNVYMEEMCANQYIPFI